MLAAVSFAGVAGLLGVTVPRRQVAQAALHKSTDVVEASDRKAVYKTLYITLCLTLFYGESLFVFLLTQMDTSKVKSVSTITITNLCCLEAN